MPESVYIIRGTVTDFTRVDNLYSSLKREADKMLKDWSISVEVKYSEKAGDIPKT